MSKTLKHEIKADYLLEKGVEIIWSKGYNGTSVNDIVKAADVPKGSFYFYFDSKEDFAIKALDKYFTMQFSPALDILQNSDGSPKERLLNFYQFRIKVLKEQLECKMGCLGCNLSNEMSEHNENIRNAVLDRHNLVKTEITKVVKEAQQSGEINSSINAEDLVGFIEDAGKGAMITMKEMKDSYPVDNHLNMVTHLLIK
ncbi:TetR family transcriptional regulator [Aquimarina sp. MMG015]|uniref:TetR/AcrR family transcriptional regulator n=1 Tax=Aquimarina TaxID=290174 RepID=UPI000400F940|nr:MULTISPECIES: TetR/AcrR family transcriptional regulator [Aquimarina]AXT57515.1 TetR family transcriptional regulator [Aquimarina sp. AD1]MBQ4801232.1 TetR family transcriptional regulator [Aquimarina sp. MMG015]RKN35777.1 TetR family transcriptional regulator [Aquimarina sp. AD1]